MKGRTVNDMLDHWVFECKAPMRSSDRNVRHLSLSQSDDQEGSLRDLVR